MANFYRVKNGNLDLAESWATTSGGGTFHAAPPTSADDVFFDASTPTGTHTGNITLNCKTLNCTGFTGTLNAAQINAYGNVTLVAGMTWLYSARITFEANATLISAGHPIAAIISTPYNLSLGDDLNIGENISISAGFVHNNHKVVFKGSSNNRTGGFTYSCNSTATLYDLEFDGLGNNYVYLDCSKLIVANKLTLKTSSYMSVLGYRAAATACELEIADGEFTNCSLWKIKGSGAFDWDLSTDTTVGNGGVCEDITFCDPITMYLVTASSVGWRSDITKWKTTSGGATTVSRLPLSHDTLIFDENSFSTTGLYINFEHGSTETHIPSINAIDVTNSPEFRFNHGNSVSWYFVGGFEIADTVTPVFLTSNKIYLTSILATDEHNLNFGTYTFSPTTKIYSFYFKNGVWTITNTLNVSAYLHMGGAVSVDFNDHIINCQGIYADGTSKLKLGDGKTTLTGSNAAYYHLFIGSGVNFQEENSTVECKGTGAGINTATLSPTLYHLIVNTTNTFALAPNANIVIDYLEVKSDMTFKAGITYTINKLKAFGIPTDKLLFKSDSTTTATLKIGISPGKIWCNYLNVSYLTSADLTTWYMGVGSTDSGNNHANIIFSSIYTNPITGGSVLSNFLN